MTADDVKRLCYETSLFATAAEVELPTKPQD